MAASDSSEPTGRDRPRPVVIGGWLAALGGAVGAVALARRLDDPAIALAGMAAAVVVVASLAAGPVAGIVGSALLGVLSWRWLDPPEPVGAGYEAGLGVGGGLLALWVGAAVQLRGFDRQRRAWLDRLDELVRDLAEVAGADEPIEVTRTAVRRATGASSVLVVPDDGAADASEGSAPHPAAGEHRVAVRSRTSPALRLEVSLPAPPPPVLAADLTAFLRSAADHCAQTLHRVALEQAEERASAYLELLARASASLSTTLEVAEVLRIVEELFVPLVADECSVRIAARPGQRRRGGGAPPEDEHSRTIALRAHGDLVGHLTLRRRNRALAGEEVEAARLLAEQIGRALDHALLYEEQVHTSSTLEHSLLPAALLPVPNLDVASRYLPATEGHAAGGDFYDVVHTPGGGVVLIVGDVQGKGVEAATLTSTARHTLRGAALGGAGPSGMLHRLNDALLYGQAERVAAGAPDPLIRFVTAAVVELTPTDEGFRAVVASGGHPPPLVIRPSGAVEQVKVDGVLLGVFDDAKFAEAAVELALADVVVLYTDGVTEQRTWPDVFDEVQLGRLVRNARTAQRTDADALAQLVLDTVVGLSPRDVRDDIALLVARVTGPR